MIILIVDCVLRIGNYGFGIEDCRFWIFENRGSFGFGIKTIDYPDFKAKRG
jgi:hypothetical protein